MTELVTLPPQEFSASGSKWGNSNTYGTPGGVVTWSFVNGTNFGYHAGDVVYEPFNWTTGYQSAVRGAFSAWQSVADIEFVEVPDSVTTDIRLGWGNDDGSGGTLAFALSYIFVSNNAFANSLISFDLAESWTTSPTPGFGQINFQAIAIHEIGHAIGLDHSNVSPSIMSAFYNSSNPVLTLQPDDIAGAQFIYGGSLSLANVVIDGTPFADTLIGNFRGNSINGFGGNDYLSGLDGNDTLNGGSGGDWLIGGSGFDIASYAGAAAGLTAHLDSRYAWSNSGDAAGDVFAGVEALEGTPFDDVLGGNKAANTLLGGNGGDLLIGRGGNDRLFGGSGDDTLVGGKGKRDFLIGDSGSDTASYAIQSGAVKASLSKPGSNTGQAKGDRYNSIENLEGSRKADQLIGDGLDNHLSGLRGADTLKGQGGNDTLEGGSKADKLNGGGGFDYASYEGAWFGVQVSLLKNLARFNTGDAKKDKLKNIEGLIGSNGDDTLNGDNGANHLIGGNGNDNVLGRGGNDTLDGGAGNDSLYGGDFFNPDYFGDDRFVFKTGYDADQIVGFDTGAGSQDVLMLSLGTSFDEFSEIQGAATDTGSGTLLTFTGGDSILLVGIASTALHQDDFIFV